MQYLLTTYYIYKEWENFLNCKNYFNRSICDEFYKGLLQLALLFHSYSVSIFHMTKLDFGKVT